MTTVLRPELIAIAEIRDRESLQIVSRVLESQRVVLESQIAQIQQLQDVVNERLKSLGEREQ